MKLNVNIKKIALERKQNIVIIIIQFQNTYYVNRPKMCKRYMVIQYVCGGNGSVINRTKIGNCDTVLVAEKKNPWSPPRHPTRSPGLLCSMCGHETVPAKGT